MEQYILAIDQSTSGTKAILFNSLGLVHARYDVAHNQIIDQNGWVEHDPKEIIRNLYAAVRGVIEQSGVDKSNIIAAGISNQRETSIVWNRADGEPFYNAIVWQCNRGEQICRDIALQGYAETVKRKTGLPLSPYYSAAKISWVLKNIPRAAEAGAAGTLCCSTMDSWLVYQLCGGEPKTEYSNASRTQLYNINDLCWDTELCKAFEIPVGSLPQVVDSNSLFGYSDFGGNLSEPIPILGVLGDSQGALFGQGCLKANDLKVTYGTGSSVMMNVGEYPCFSKNGLVTSIAWGIDGEINYVLEGNINDTGAVIHWMVDKLGILENESQAGLCAAQAGEASDIFLVPAFGGLGAPYWRSDARALICGMDRNTTKAEIVRAAEECIAYQVTDVINGMKSDTSKELSVIRADGGATKDRYLMQFQADIAQIVVQASDTEELSGRGPAYLAGQSAGIYDPMIIQNKHRTTDFIPKMCKEEASRRYAGWKNAVQLALIKGA